MPETWITTLAVCILGIGWIRHTRELKQLHKRVWALEENQAMASRRAALWLLTAISFLLGANQISRAADKPSRGKFIVHVFTQKGCKFCRQLENDWRASNELRAIADPSDTGRGWAKLAVHKLDEDSNTFDLMGVKVTPMVIVTTASSTNDRVSQQKEYTGNASGLAAKLVSDAEKWETSH